MTKMLIKYSNKSKLIYVTIATDKLMFALWCKKKKKKRTTLLKLFLFNSGHDQYTRRRGLWYLKHYRWRLTVHCICYE
jgi:hypothetical protein